MKIWIEMSKNVLVEARIHVASSDDQVIVQMIDDVSESDVIKKFPESFRDQVTVVRHPVEVSPPEEAEVEVPERAVRVRSPLSPPPVAAANGTSSLRDAMSER